MNGILFRCQPKCKLLTSPYNKAVHDLQLTFSKRHNQLNGYRAHEFSQVTHTDYQGLHLLYYHE